MLIKTLELVVSFSCKKHNLILISTKFHYGIFSLFIACGRLSDKKVDLISSASPLTASESFE